MGTACASAGKDPDFDISDKQPADTQQYRRGDLPTLDFEVEISNVKLRNLPDLPSSLKAISLQLMIEGVLDFILQPKPVCSTSNTMKWKVSHRSRMSLTQYELRKKFLRINVFNESRIKATSLSLNLYFISTGPYHQDFPLRFDKKSARISLDVRISQLVKIYIEPVRVGVELVNQHPGEVFHYSLKTVGDQGTEVETEESYRAETILYNKRPSITEIQSPSPILKKRQSLKSKKSLIVDHGQRLIWTKGQSIDLCGQQLPTFHTTINISKIPSYSFQFLLWLVCSQTQNQSDSVSEEIHLYADTHINFNKIFVEEHVILKKDGIDYQKRETVITEKIWNEGRLLGKVEMKCSVLVPQHYKQMLVCLRTEQGIAATRVGLVGGLQHQLSACAEIKKLNELKETVEEALMKLNMSLNHQYKILNSKRSIYQGIVKMQEILCQSASKHKRIYGYRSEQDLLKGQLVLLEIGFKLLECLEEEDASMSDACWKTLTELIGREELGLVHMGIVEFSAEKDRMEIMVKYQGFTYKALKASLTSLAKKALLDNQRIFAVLFSAQAFFRIPEYQEMVLDLLVSGQKDKDMLEQMGLSTGLKLIKSDQSLKPFLDWETNFYQHIKNHSSAEDNYSLLRQTLENTAIRKKMGQRGLGFFCLVAECVDYVRRLTPSPQINWASIPGYPILVEMFLCEMVDRPVSQYPDALKQASIRLLSNQTLLNLKIRILFMKTNLFTPTAVLKTLQIVDSYLQFISKTNKKLPSSFDYKYFYAGLKHILNSDHSFMVARCLNLLYKHYTLFSPAFRKDLSMSLMGSLFFKLFLNWAGNVRMMFHHLLVYRIGLDCRERPKINKYSTSNNPVILPMDDSQVEEMRYRCQIVITVLTKAKEQRCRDQQMETTHYELDYHKRMKARLIEMRIHKKDKASLKTSNIEKCKERYSLVMLGSTPPVRYKSETMPVLYVAIQLGQHNVNSEKVLRTSTDFTNTKRKTCNIQLTEIAQTEQLCREKKKRRTNFELDHQLAEIQYSQLEYLEVAMRQYYDIGDLFEKTMAPSFSHLDAPNIAIKVPIDEGDIRPENIDEW